MGSASAAKVSPNNEKRSPREDLRRVIWNILEFPIYAKLKFHMFELVLPDVSIVKLLAEKPSATNAERFVLDVAICGHARGSQTAYGTYPREILRKYSSLVVKA